ncbi:MAG: DUF2950 family protein, partial [Candidatus Binatia bacterium]
MAKLANKIKERSINSNLQSLVVAIALMFSLYDICAAAVVQQKSFSSAEEAVKAAVAAARSNHDKELLAIFGAAAKEILYSGDAVADKERRAHFLAAFDEKHRLATEAEETVLI